VKDANGANVAYVYYEEERGRRAAANLMTKDEAPLVLPAGIEPAAQNSNATPQEPWSNPCQI
jgi:hypothetical protein